MGETFARYTTEDPQQGNQNQLPETDTTAAQYVGVSIPTWLPGQ